MFLSLQKNIFALILVAALSFAIFSTAQAADILSASTSLDNLSVSTASNQTLLFEIPTGINAGEDITLTYAAGWDLSALVVTDIDLSHEAAGGDGVCDTGDTELALAAAPVGATWGVAIVGQVITFTSGTGTIPVNSQVCVEIGTNAESLISGTNQITNPGTAGNYLVTISSRAGADSVGISVPILGSSQVAVTAVVPSSVPNSDPVVSSPPGSGVNRNYCTDNNILFTGYAYPGAEVTLLQNGSLVDTQKANSTTAEFSISSPNIAQGEHIMTLYAVDGNGLRSTLFTFPISIDGVCIKTIFDLRIPPTIQIKPPRFSHGTTAEVTGYSMPGAKVDLLYDFETFDTDSAVADENGRYAFFLDSNRADIGNHVVKAKALGVNGVQTEYGKFSRFVILEDGGIEIVGPIRGDFDNNGVVNFEDISAALGWYGRALTGEVFSGEGIRLNGDGLVTLQDVSIIAHEIWRRSS